MGLAEGRIKTVQAVERSLAIIEVLAEIGSPMTLSDLSGRVKLNASTAHRLLATLIVRGFVEQDPHTGRYRLGIKVFKIGNNALYGLDIRTVAKPCLRKLVDKCNETANLAILDCGEVVYIDQVESHNMVKAFASLGSRFPAYCSGLGKTLLSALNESELEAFFKGIVFKKFTGKTIDNLERLKKELAKVRMAGYALDLEESEDGVNCAGAPVYNYEGNVVASVSISGPTTRITTKRLEEELIHSVKETATEISNKLGYDGTRLSRMRQTRRHGL
jgi:DNA-binding IclR family transcriptional regulator